MKDWGSLKDRDTVDYCGTSRFFCLEKRRRRRYAETKRSVSDAAIIDDFEVTAAAITRAVLPRGVGGLLSKEKSRQSLLNCGW